ncbi:rhamnan synthesis F family protein, partial [Desulfovibrio sp. OttesenSCG-928-I05]|nr:rhamnan synthesis F family protein [Desulfovibrio sp. OttesenSCG-928-I05]
MYRIFEFLYRKTRNATAYMLYLCIYNFLKIRQLPMVMAQRQPVFVSDETCCPNNGDVYAIVVKYAGFGLETGFLEMLDAMRQTGINAIVVCNGAPDESMLASLRKSAHRILVRENIGRDMGAYRAATLYLYETGLNPHKIIYCNDSVFFLEGKPLLDMFSTLANSTSDVHGTFENHQFNYHFGSYVFSISG